MWCIVLCAAFVCAWAFVPNAAHAQAEHSIAVLVNEHNLDVTKWADWLIDLGREGGEGGGKVVAQGTPEQVAKTKNSATGHFLSEILK